MYHDRYAQEPARRLGVTLLAVASMATLVQVRAVQPASADAATICALQTEGCFIDRYEDPSIDFGDLDSGNIAIPPESGGTVTTTSYPHRRNATNGAGVTFRGLTTMPGGVNGVDIALYDPNVNKNAAGVAQNYLPCKNTGDPYKGACTSPTTSSYFAARNYSGGTSSNPWPSGMLVGNSTTNAYCSPCSHAWGNRIYEADLEFYPRKPGTSQTDPNWVRPRFTSRGEFPSTASGNGWNMTPDWGSIAGRYLTDPYVGRLSGNFYATTGVPLSSGGRMIFSVFNSSFPATNVSSTGKPLGSFFSGANGTNGFYTTGAMYAATYNMTIRDATNGRQCKWFGKTWNSIGLRADFILDRQDSGSPTLKPMRWGRRDYSECNF